MLGVGIIAPLLSLYAEKLGATGIWLGVIFSSFSISRGIVMPFIGRLSDRYGRKWFICIGILIYALVSLGYIWAADSSQLTLVRLIHGAASGMIIPVAQAYIAEISPENEVGTWMGYFNAAFITGFGFGPLMGGVLSDHFGMTVAFSSMGGLNMVAFLIAMFFLPEVRRKKAEDNTHLSFKEMSTSRMMRGLFGFRVAFDMGMGIIFTFLPIFATLSVGLSPGQTGVLIATNILLMSSLQSYFGKLADRVSRRALIIAGGLISIAFLVMLPSARDFWQLLAVCAIGGIGGAVAMPASSALTIEEGRKFGMGSTIAIIFMAMSIGAVIGPILGGVIVDTVNINSVFYFAAAAGLLGTSLFIRFTR